jgi:hypothetical protein
MSCHVMSCDALDRLVIENDALVSAKCSADGVL